MLQYDLVNILLEKILKDGLVDACFLKGSLAREEEDQYSNVDFYCVVSNEKKDVFNKKKIKYLESYKPIMHFFDDEFQSSKTTCIYDNGVCIDLNIVSINELKKDKILVVYDPNNILNEYIGDDLNLTPDDLGKIVNKFSLNCIYFHKAFKREDLLLAFRIASSLHSYYLRLMHYYINPSRSKLGLRQLERNFDEDIWREIIALTKLIKYESILIGVKTITVAMQERIVNLPISVTMHIDYDFFLYAKKQIFSIDEE